MDVQTLWHMFIASSFGIAFMQYLKNAKWFPWAQQMGTKYANRALAIVVSLFGATGIHYAWDPQAHTLLLMNLTFWGIANSLWHWGQQFILQEFMYQASVNNRTQFPRVGATGTIEGDKVKGE